MSRVMVLEGIIMSRGGVGKEEQGEGWNTCREPMV